MKKRVISLILALVMVIGILSVNVLAAEPAEQVQTPQAVTIETSLDGELTDGVFTTAEEPLDVKIRAAADGETVVYSALGAAVRTAQATEKAIQVLEFPSLELLWNVIASWRSPREGTGA